MKKSLIRVLSVVLAITILSACLTAGAELKLNAGSIDVHSGIKISVDGKEFVPGDSEGAPVEVFLYNGTTFISYDDPKSVRLKCEYALEHNMAGAFYWVHDTDMGSVLFDTIYDTLNLAD